MPVPGYWDTEWTVTNRGIRVRRPLKDDEETKSFLGFLSCGALLQDVAIELYYTSNTIGDLDHLARLYAPVRLGNWNYDPHVEFKTVYLTTGTLLRHLNHFGPRFWKTEYEFHLLLPEDDTEDFSNLDDTRKVCIHPREADVRDLGVGFVATRKIKRIAVVNPANSNTKAVTVIIPTPLSQDIVLKIGFFTLENGLLDVQNPWTMISPVPKNALREGLSLDKTSNASIVVPPGASELVIGQTQVRVEVVQQTW